MKGITLKDGVKGMGELAIIVVDQEIQRSFPAIEFPNKLSGLLGEPDIVGMGSDAGEVHHTLSGVPFKWVFLIVAMSISNCR
jgi:hypothetical protein